MSAGAPVDRLRHVGVLVPVRDEEDLLPGCLDAVAAAVQHLRRARPGLAVRVVVVLDGCTDGSADVVRRAPGPDVAAVTTPALGVGAARAAGAAALLRWAAGDGGDPATTWLAGTDADSTVDPGWLCAQADAADAGADAWVGTVELGALQPGSQEPVHPAGSVRARVAARWSSHQRHHEDHDHVHGANLGVRGSAYLAAGGYPAVLTGEDVALVGRLRATGAVLVRTARLPVTTSDRSAGRAPDGVASDLAELLALEPLPVAGHPGGLPPAAEAS